MSKVSNYCQKI